MLKETRTWQTVIASGVLATIGYFFLPSATTQNVAYGVIGMASVVLIVIGVRRNDPADPWAWYLIAVAGLLFTLGDDVYTFYGSVLHEGVSFPSYADALYLAGYPFLFVGVVRLTRGEEYSSRREDTADAAIVAMGVLALSWQFLMSDYVNDPTLTMLGAFVNVAYPVMDIALVFILFRALVFRKFSVPSHRLLAASMSLMFVADSTYDVMVLHASYATGNFVDGLYFLEYSLIAAAALHPSSGRRHDVARSAAAPSPSDAQSRIRVPFLVVAGFATPTILVIASSLHETVNVVALGIICIIVFAIIFLRLNWLIQRIGAQSLRLSHNLRDLELAQLQREELEANLRHQALHDPLTGLANRTLFEDRLRHAQERAVRSDGRGAVLLMDLDDFKGVNDTFGHLVGDQLLVSIAHRLEAVTRSSDMLCRLGGDEFLYLAESISSVAESENVAKRLLSEFTEPFVIDSVRLEQHASIGVSVFDAQPSTDRNVVQEADVALYQAKSAHKGNYVVFSPTMQESAIDRFTMVQELRDALRARDVSMHFQPILALESSRIVGFEALMRWHHPQRGLVPPSVFIPLAEQSDLIIALGAFALRESLNAAKSWRSTSPGERAPYVTVNFSAHQFHQPDVVSMIRDALASSDISPHRLIIEITEGAALNDVTETAKVIAELADLGIGIALDDFGTGFSSLSYLVLLHPRIIKIDRSFVSPARESATSHALLEEIINLGRRLGITVLAEGIETEVQLARLRQMGCELGQGFLFSAAVAADQVAGLMQSLRASSSLHAPGG